MKSLVIYLITIILVSLSVNIVIAAENEQGVNNPPLTENEFNPTWYLDFSLEPSQQDIDGLPLSEVSDELSHIELLSCEDEQHFSRQQCQQLAASGGTFEAVVDLDGDGRVERWRTGLAKTYAGEIVNILLIQNHHTNDVLKIMVLHSLRSGFSALYHQDGYFMWSMCLHCDVLADITWANNDYQLMWDYQLAAY